MQEQGQQYGNPVSRPMTRPTAMPQPIQRGNYGIPARQSPPLQQPVAQPVAAPAPAAPTPVAPVVAAPPRPAPIPSTPQFMDFAPSRPAASRPNLVNAAAQPAPATPVFAQNPAPVAPTEEKRPLFTPAPATPKTAARPGRHINKLKYLRVGLTGLAIILVIAGGVRFTSAGSTTNDTIAVGAVSANNGRSMTIQFTATDGKLHKYSTASDQDLIPGSAVQVAYRSGAPEATVRQVSIVENGRNMGVMLVLAGVASLATVGAISVGVRIKNRGQHSNHSLTTPLTV